MSNRRPPLLLLSMVLGAACSARPTQSDGESTGGTTTEAPPSTRPTPLTTTSGVADSTSTTIASTGSASSSGSTTTTSGVSFICNEVDDEFQHCDDGGGIIDFECDLFAQDCPDGEKCMAWSNDGSDAWNASRCSPLEPMPDVVGQTCSVEGSAVSGIDSCAFGSMCWDVDPATNEGECVALCTGDEASPVCAEGTQCAIFNEGSIILCLPQCEPLVPMCGDGYGCLPTGGDGWVCMPTVGPPVATGQACEFHNTCEVGSVCAVAEASPDCVGPAGCCAPLCSVGGGACPDAATECEPWHAPGQAPPGFENAGVCSVEPAMPVGGWMHSYVLVAGSGA